MAALRRYSARMEPSLRKPFGVLLVVVYLVVYVIGSAMLFTPVERLHVLIQTPIWLAIGLAWVLPLRPLLRWMETGRWR